MSNPDCYSEARQKRAAGIDHVIIGKDHWDRFVELLESVNGVDVIAVKRDAALFDLVDGTDPAENCDHAQKALELDAVGRKEST